MGSGVKLGVNGNGVVCGQAQVEVSVATGILGIVFASKSSVVPHEDV
jgi:hypothetical protein